MPVQFNFARGQEPEIRLAAAPIPPSPTSSLKLLVPTLAAIILVAVAGTIGYLSYRKGTTQATPSPSPVTRGDVQWQPWSLQSGIVAFPTPDPSNSYGIGATAYYKVGTFVAGKYAGGDLILAEQQPEGPGGPMYYRFARSTSGQIVLLERLSDAYWLPEGVARQFSIDRDYNIPELDAPKTIQSSDGTFTLERDQLPFSFMRLWKNYDGGHFVTAFTHPVFGPVLTDAKPDIAPTPDASGALSYYPRYGYYVRLPDDTVVTYAPKIDFIEGTNMPSIRWTDPQHIQGGQYTWRDVGGCGASSYLAVVATSEIRPNEDLREAGRASNGDKIYELKDTNHPFLKNIYENVYNPVFEQGGKVSYADFIRQAPVFFWFDQLGRTVRFLNTSFVPPAECGKPVIYLYPEQTQYVSVRVAPQGGLTKSEPEYGDGWYVLARPNGELTEARTGTKWPYLFWEGRGATYVQPDRGWSVAQADVPKFLDEKLAAFGLNAREIADFKEFWLPRMRSAPYYFVTFLGNSAMDRMAPLNILPRPDSIIRVLMDFSPRSGPTEPRPFEIVSPKRSGFTVVEWGGVIR